MKYEGEHLDRIAYPMGGMGTGMICLEGHGGFSHLSVRHEPDLLNTPTLFAALSVNGKARILEGQVARWKILSRARKHGFATMGLPRFRETTFEDHFPFAEIALSDPAMPLTATITGWSPFVPGDADASSLPVAGLEYTFHNPGDTPVDATFTMSATNFMSPHGMEGTSGIGATDNGFVLWKEGTETQPWNEAAFAIFADTKADVDHCWFRGQWFDGLTVAWRAIERGVCRNSPPLDAYSPGASLFVPVHVEPGETQTVGIRFAWYAPRGDVYCLAGETGGEPPKHAETPDHPTHEPWYAGRFSDVDQVVAFWREHYDVLRDKTRVFTDAFYDTTLPAEVVDGIAANLTILKSPTVLRQKDGRLWCWECCSDATGLFHGSCTHVWNYAQAFAHLFPDMERSLRETEFHECQDDRGHQSFRASLPIADTTHGFPAAADGQLGGIMKVYRDWRISGDTDWLRSLWPRIRQSMEFCIGEWDPREKGLLEEPQHNTYDIEFWGPNGMLQTCYVGALEAMVRMAAALDEDTTRYQTLLDQSYQQLETLFNGEYYAQHIQWEGLNATYDCDNPSIAIHLDKASPEDLAVFEKEGPKFQYGNGCLSDGVFGFWLADMCGLVRQKGTVPSETTTGSEDGTIPASHTSTGERIVHEPLALLGNTAHVRSTLEAIYRYNFKDDLSDYVNLQFAQGAVAPEGGLVLCTWPNDDQPTLPFVYCNMVWNGIDFQVACHLIRHGFVEEGLQIVRTNRARYDGVTRNPFNPYEVGFWYARALSCYGLLQALTGVRYDAVEKTLYFDSRVGDDFRVFLSTDTGFGVAGLKAGEPFFNCAYGSVDIKQFHVA